jgi:hypothetical protein
MGFGLVIVFIEHLQIVTTKDYISLTNLHTPKITLTTEHVKTSQFIFNNCFLVAASNGGRSPSSVFPNCPRAQLSAFHLSQLQLLTDSTTTELLVSCFIACSPFAGETCPHSCSRATAVVLSHVYTAAT